MKVTLDPIASEQETNGATNYVPTSYDIDPTDQQIADSILAIDPLNEITGSGSMSESIAVAAVPYSALSPEMRAEVDKALEGVPPARRADAEQAAVLNVLKARTAHHRTLTGLGDGATEYHREMANIAAEHRQLAQEWNRVAKSMAEVLRHDTGPDGKPVPVYAMGPASQRNAANRLEEINYRLNLLMDADGRHGPEAQRRLAKALHQSVETQKAQAAQLAERREAEELADKINRDRRVAQMAEGIAKHRRNDVL